MTTDGRHRGAARIPRAELLALKERVARLHLDAGTLTLPAKVEATMRQWFSRNVAELDEDAGVELAALAAAMALELESVTPSMSGTTAVDRLARQRAFDADHAAAYRMLKGARFSIFKARRADGDDLYAAEDLSSGTSFTYVDEALPPGALGVPLAAQLCDLGEGLRGAFGLVLPLDDAALAVAMDFVRPGRGIPHGHRCAAAVYKHLVRHGGPKIAGLNAFDGLMDDLRDNGPEIASPLDPIASRLVAEDLWREPPVAVLDEVRRLVGADTLAVCLFKAVESDTKGRSAFGLVYRRFAEVMVEALHLRALAGTGLERDPLGRLAALLDREVATNGYPRSAADLFREIRRAVAAAKPRDAGDDLTRVIERIRGLRAKTVDQGCTEEEALAAADKVAELLDRYGLSLGETDLRGQACLGVGIDSQRKRSGPFDEAVPAISNFCGCRSWSERAPDGTIRSVFFGLPADVEAARYLHDRVAAALATETAAFQRSELYRERAGGARQKATASFQYGLVRGIGAKLDARKAERDARTFETSGRDLVPVKASVVEDELARLGMAFTMKESNRGRIVLPDAYEAGHVASGRFEIQSEIGHG